MLEMYATVSVLLVFAIGAITLWIGCTCAFKRASTLKRKIYYESLSDEDKALNRKAYYASLSGEGKAQFRQAEVMHRAAGE